MERTDVATVGRDDYDESEWGKLNAGQEFIAIAQDVLRALAQAGLGTYEWIVLGQVMERSWLVPARRKRSGEEWPDPVPCLLGISDLARDLADPGEDRRRTESRRVRLSEARSRLIRKHMLIEDGEAVWPNEDAETWTKDDGVTPLLGPGALRYALRARTRKEGRGRPRAGHEAATPTLPVLGPSRAKNRTGGRGEYRTERCPGPVRNSPRPRTEFPTVPYGIPHGAVRNSPRRSTPHGAENDGPNADEPATSAGPSRARTRPRKDPTGLEDPEDPPGEEGEAPPATLPAKVERLIAERDAAAGPLIRYAETLGNFVDSHRPVAVWAREQVGWLTVRNLWWLWGLILKKFAGPGARPGARHSEAMLTAVMHGYRTRPDGPGSEFTEVSVLSQRAAMGLLGPDEAPPPAPEPAAGSAPAWPATPYESRQSAQQRRQHEGLDALFPDQEDRDGRA